MDAATETMIRNFPEKTGKSLDEWVAIVKKLGPKKHGELVKFLKESHGMGHGYANLVVHTAAGLMGENAVAGDDLVAAQYSGDKAALRPMYEQLLKAVTAFGKDVEVSPKKTCVSLRRSRQFAMIQPSTKTRLDVGLNLKGVKPSGRLEASGSFSAMCTHRVRVESPDQIDAALIGWIKDAYDRS
jgi:predicted transport protein